MAVDSSEHNGEREYGLEYPFITHFPAGLLQARTAPLNSGLSANKELDSRLTPTFEVWPVVLSMATSVTDWPSRMFSNSSASYPVRISAITPTNKGMPFREAIALYFLTFASMFSRNRTGLTHPHLEKPSH